MGLLNLLAGVGGDPWAGFRDVGKQSLGDQLGISEDWQKRLGNMGEGFAMAGARSPVPQMAPMQQAPQMGGSLQQLIDAWMAMNKPGGSF